MWNGERTLVKRHWGGQQVLGAGLPCLPEGLSARGLAAFLDIQFVPLQFPVGVGCTELRVLKVTPDCSPSQFQPHTCMWGKTIT